MNELLFANAISLQHITLFKVSISFSVRLIKRIQRIFSFNLIIEVIVMKLFVITPYNPLKIWTIYNRSSILENGIYVLTLFPFLSWSLLLEVYQYYSFQRLSFIFVFNFLYCSSLFLFKHNALCSYHFLLSTYLHLTCFFFLDPEVGVQVTDFGFLFFSNIRT